MSDCYVTASMGQESGRGLHGFLWLSLPWTAVKATVADIPRLDRGRSPSKLTFCGCCQASRPHWLLTRDVRFLPPGPLREEALLMAGNCPQSKWAREDWEQARQKPQSFYDLISKMASCHFCHCLCVRSESLIGSSLRSGEVGYNTKAWTPGGRILRPSWSLTNIVFKGTLFKLLAINLEM